MARQFAMVWQLHDVRTPTRTLLMVSRFGHCLNDLLFRTSTGALNIEIPAIVSNHRDFEGVAEANGIPFHHVPVTADTTLYTVLRNAAGQRTYLAYNASRSPLTVRFSTGVSLEVKPFELRMHREARP